MADNASASGVPPLTMPVPGLAPQHMPQGFAPAAFSAGQLYAQQFAQHYAAQNQQQNVQSEQLRSFWRQQQTEIENVPADPAEFKNHQLPLARIKKIMKSDEDVRMISAEAPVLFAKACELFILELTLRSWNHAEENKRRTLQRTDVAAAITRTDIFDFLVDIVPREEIKQEGEGMTVPVQAPGPMPVAAPRLPPQASLPTPMGPVDQMYYPFPPQAMDPSAMLRPPMPIDPLMFQQTHQFLGGLPGQAWPQAAPVVQQQQQQQQQQQVPQAGPDGGGGQVPIKQQQ